MNTLDLIELVLAISTMVLILLTSWLVIYEHYVGAIIALIPTSIVTGIFLVASSVLGYF